MVIPRGSPGVNSCGFLQPCALCPFKRLFPCFDGEPLGKTRPTKTGVASLRVLFFLSFF